MIRRLIPGRDIYRVEKLKGGPDRLDYPWRVVCYSHNVSRGLHVSEHSTRDEARAAKIKHEEADDAARGR